MPRPAAPLIGRAPSAGGPMLVETVRRTIRQLRPACLVAVRLGPGARPHHRRILRAMLDDAAARHCGQVLALDVGDLVLLCPDEHAPPDLPPLLARLLPPGRGDATVDIWCLPQDGPAALAWAEQATRPAAATTVAAPEPPSVPAGAVERLVAAAQGARVADLARRQTAVVLIGSANGDAPARQVRPLFREASFSIAALAAAAGADATVQGDPYLIRHLAGRLDHVMLPAVAEAAGRGGPFDPCHPAAPRLHLNLVLETVFHPAFDALARQAGQRGGHGLGVEVDLLEALAEPARLAEAALRLDALGCALVIDRVPIAGLPLADLTVLPKALLKLDWTPPLARLDGAEADAVDAALARLSAARVVLRRADTEAAVRWGLARGIRRFQGRHADAMLAAARLGACRDGVGCTLRQCVERHAAAGAATRAFCRNHALLDAGAPEDPGIPDRGRPRPRLAA